MFLSRETGIQKTYSGDHNPHESCRRAYPCHVSTVELFIQVHLHDVAAIGGSRTHVVLVTAYSVDALLLDQVVVTYTAAKDVSDKNDTKHQESRLTVCNAKIVDKYHTCYLSREYALR